VSLAGVLDLALAEKERIGRDAATNFLGGSSARYPDRFAVADPAAHPVVEARVRIVHGTEDDVVPMSQSVSYVHAATAAGQDATLARVAGDHMDIIDVRHDSWPITLAAINELTSGTQNSSENVEASSPRTR
jgi:fermentation-respiration switch protein FrsA (DUF1100 family)